MNTSSTDEGYSGTSVWTFYQPIHAVDPPPPLPYTGRTSLTCTIDPATDALVAVTVRATNTTPGFTNTMELTNDLVPSEAAANTDTLIGGSPACTQIQGPAFNLYTVEFQNVPPGGEVYDAYWYVLHGYYSPSEPNGDPTRLAGFLTIQQQIGIIELGPTNALSTPTHFTSR